MFNRLFSLFTISILLIFPSISVACSCADDADKINGDISRWTGVFTAKVISVTEDCPEVVQTNGQSIEINNCYRTKVSVIRRWKGASTNEFDIFSTGMGGGDCGWRPEEGASYLFFTTREKNREVFGDCTPTVPFDNENTSRSRKSELDAKISELDAITGIK